MQKQVSIVIPVHNEERAIEKVIKDIKDELIKISELEYEIIVINDASTDKSKEILEKQDKIKLINHPYNKGYGSSLKTGIKESKFDWMLIIDADGTYPANLIHELLNYIPEYDMVVAARKKYRPFYGRPAKWFLNKLASYLTENKVVDINSGLRVFRKQIVRDFMNLFPERFSFTSTLTMICLTSGYKVKNVEANYLKRKGKSKLRPIKSFKKFTGLIMKLILYFRPLRIFVPLSFLLFFAALVIFIYSAIFTPKVLDVTTAILIISSVQMLAIGMIADLMVRFYKK